MVLGKLNHYFIPFTKVNSKWIKVLDIRPKPMSHWREYKQHDTDFRGVFSHSVPMARLTKAKINRWCYIKLKKLKIKNFDSTKETVSETKRHSNDWKKVLIRHTSWQRADIQDGQTSIMGRTIPIKKGRKAAQNFTREDRWPTSTWTDAHYHFSQGNAQQTDRAIAHALEDSLYGSQSWWGQAEKGPVHCWWERKLAQTLRWKMYGGFSRNEN